PDPADASRSLRDQTDKVFAKWDSTVSPGCALSVMQDGRIIYKRGYGMADLDHDIPITPETIFHVASISKQFTAAPIILLAQNVKRVANQSFREFTTTRIFEPLGMTNTHFRDDHAEIVEHIAYGYAEGKGRGVYRLSVTNFDTVGATSLLTTVEDLAHWDENFYHPRVGGPTLVSQQLERGKLASGKELDYAFGLVHGKYRGLSTIDHAGADAGYRADLL